MITRDRRRHRRRPAAVLVAALLLLGLAAAGCGVSEEDRRAAAGVEQRLRERPGVDDVSVEQHNDFNGHSNQFFVKLAGDATLAQVEAVIEDVGDLAGRSGLRPWSAHLEYTSSPTQVEYRLGPDSTAGAPPDPASALAPRAAATLLDAAHRGDLADAATTVSLGEDGGVDVTPTGSDTVVPALRALHALGVDGSGLRWTFDHGQPWRLEVEDRPLDASVEAAWLAYGGAVLAAPDGVLADSALTLFPEQAPRVTVRVDGPLQVPSADFTPARAGTDVGRLMEALVALQEPGRLGPGDLTVERYVDAVDNPGRPDGQGMATLLLIVDGTVQGDTLELGWDDAAAAALGQPRPPAANPPPDRPWGEPGDHLREGGRG